MLSFASILQAFTSPSVPIISSLEDLDSALLQAENIKADLDNTIQREVVSKYADRILILDIRTPREFIQAHMKGSINLDWTTYSVEQCNRELQRLRQVYPRKDILLIYCRSGSRSSNFVHGMKD